MIYFISIHGSYNKLDVALFRDADCLAVVTKHDIKASSCLIPVIDELLKKNKLSLKDISFFAVDRGPGAFTSLRVTIATVNGIAFAQGIPLVGVGGLDALKNEAVAVSGSALADKTIVCLLNAYNNDVYYSIYKPDATPIIGYKKIEDLCVDLTTWVDQPLVLVGNGVEIYRATIQQILGDRYQVVDPFIALPSAKYVGLMAYDLWCSGNRGDLQLTPLYLKTQLFAVKK